MAKYRLNEAGEWVRVWPEPPSDPPEPSHSMADYIKRANEASTPEIDAQRHEWKMKGDMPGRGTNPKVGPRGGKYTEGVTKDGRPYRRYF